MPHSPLCCMFLLAHPQTYRIDSPTAPCRQLRHRATQMTLTRCLPRPRRTMGMHRHVSHAAAAVSPRPPPSHSDAGRRTITITAATSRQTSPLK